MKRILIIGGTQFVGRVLVERLLAEGIEPTLFHRGKTNADLFPDLRRFLGDRDTDDHTAIAGHDWDVVFDMCAYYPLSLATLLDRCRGRIGRYVLISSISALDLRPIATGKLADDSELLPCSAEAMNDTTGASYGARKAECERVTLAREWLDSIILRPALVFGRYDFTDRLYYWLQRCRTNTELLLPEEGVRKTTFSYVDDLASAMLAGIDAHPERQSFNAGTHILSFAEIVASAAAQMQVSPDIVSAPAAFLIEQGIQQWTDMPLWINGNDLQVDSRNFCHEFLPSPTKWTDALSATIEYYEPRGWPAGNYGISPEKEQELIGLIREAMA